MKPATIVASIALLISAIGMPLLFRQTPGHLTNAPPSAARTLSLRLNGAAAPRFAGEMVAARSGVFARSGVPVALNFGNAATNEITSVVKGVDSFGVVRSDEFLVARSKGAPIVAFAAGYLESPVVFYTLEKSEIHTPFDFMGKRIARRSGQDTAIIYDALLAKLQISRGQVHEIATSTNISALLNGDVDVWPGHIGEDSFILDGKGISYNIIRPSDYGIHVPGTVYFTSEKMIREHPMIVQKFLNAVIAGWKATYADYSKSVPLISSFDSKELTPDRVLFALKAQRDIVLPLGRRFTEFDDTQWKMLLNILTNEGLIRGLDSVDLSKAITYDFLKEAYRKPISFGE